ncbi:MAG: hypothetical protein U0744_15530 [Gemmataceae bacterium]
MLTRLLRSPDPRVRGAATKAIGSWHDRLPGAATTRGTGRRPLRAFALEAVPRRYAHPSADALQSALVALDHPMDPLLDFSLRKAAIVLDPYWRPQFQAGKLTFGGKVKHLSFALQAVKAPDALPVLAKLIRSKSVAEQKCGRHPRDPRRQRRVSRDGARAGRIQRGQSQRPRIALALSKRSSNRFPRIPRHLGRTFPN